MKHDLIRNKDGSLRLKQGKWVECRRCGQNWWKYDFSNRPPEDRIEEEECPQSELPGLEVNTGDH